jgi:hypothetical protein
MTTPTSHPITTEFDISVAEALDTAMVQILNAMHRQVPVTSLHVRPRVYDLVATAKAKELARGEPLVLLGLPVVADDTLTGDRPELG